MPQYGSKCHLHLLVLVAPPGLGLVLAALRQSATHKNLPLDRAIEIARLQAMRLAPGLAVGQRAPRLPNVQSIRNE
jgi:hypothetical protein